MKTVQYIIAFTMVTLLIWIVDSGCAGRAQETMATGSFTATVVRGQVCPVQTQNTPCPPEPAHGVTLVILNQAAEEVASVVTDTQGQVSISLPPGIYRIEMPFPDGMEFTKDLPAHITITDGQQTRLDIYIDSGIR
jgi:hypothetical protein